MPAVEAAGELTSVKSSDETSFSVDRAAASGIDGDGPGAVQIDFSFSDPYHSAWFRMNADGSGLELTSED